MGTVRYRYEWRNARRKQKRRELSRKRRMALHGSHTSEQSWRRTTRRGRPLPTIE
jgi:hypothetical protein